MKFVFASDSFKGTLESGRIADILEEKARMHFPGCETVKLSMADGGEGTVESVIKAVGGMYRFATVTGPAGMPVEAKYGVLPDSRVIIEMAAASGLPLVPKEKRNPLETSSYGTGELIADALSQGYRNITIGLGGSATNDGGMGAMSALGIRFLDACGNVLWGNGENLARVRSIDDSRLMKEAKEAQFTLMCDVRNPLLGENGAAYTFGRQKGADSEMLCRLEWGMENYAVILEGKYHHPVKYAVGGGAAGGMGAACMVFLGAGFCSGIEALLELAGFDRILKDADFIITGEGCVDSSSADGKVLWGIGKYARKCHVPVIAIVGGIGKGAEKLYDCGISSMFPIVKGPVSLEEAFAHAEEFYGDTADRVFRLLKTGFGYFE